MKKILFMVSSMNIGGVEKSLLSLLSVMPREKYDITLMVLERRGGFLEYIPEWVNVDEADWYKTVKSIIMQPPQHTVKEYCKSKRYIKSLWFIWIYIISKALDNRYLFYNSIFKRVPTNSDSYDVAIAYQAPTDIIDFYIAKKVKAKKRLSWVHFDVSKFLINKKLYSKLYRRFNKIFVVSEAAEKHLIELIPELASKTQVLLNVISPDLIVELSQEPVEFDDSFKGIKVLTVGRLSEEKGQDMAIRVLYKLRSEGYNVRWYCVGEGKGRKEYEELINRYNLKNEFILLGGAANPYPYVDKADIYVQTSRHEGYCLTLTEAKCLRKPIVTTNFIGAYEQLVDGYNGLISGCSENELYEKVKYLLDNPSERDRLSKNLSGISINTTSEASKLINYINF